MNSIQQRMMGMFKIKAPDGRNNLCGERIAQIRKERRLSQRKLSRQMQLLGYDVDNHFIRRVENGQRFVTDIDLMIFCRALNVPLTEILDFDEAQQEPAASNS